MSFVARMLAFSCCLLPTLAAALPTAQPAPPSERLVYLVRDLDDENLIVLGSALAAWREDSVLLLDSLKASPYLKAFLAAYQPARVVPVGGDASGIADLEGRLNVKTTAPLTWTRGQPTALWRSLFERADDVVVCPVGPRGALLQAACLAATLRAPLYVLHGRENEAARLARLLGEWRTRRVHLVGKAEKWAEHPHTGSQDFATSSSTWLTMFS